MRTSIEKIISSGLVETLVHEIGKSETAWNLEDLIQDIYLDLLTKQDKLETIPESQLRYYIARIVINNVHSKTSPYYTTYKKTDKDEEIEGLDGRL